MKAKDLDKKFHEGRSILEHLDLSRARRPEQEQKRVNVDFPLWGPGFSRRTKRCRGPFEVTHALPSNMKADVDDVPIPDNVILSLQVESALFTHVLFRPAVHQIITGKTFGPDETASQIRMNGFRRLDSGASIDNVPGPHFIRDNSISNFPPNSTTLFFFSMTRKIS